LDRALAYPKLRKRIEHDHAVHVTEWLRSTAEVAVDPEDPPAVRSPDPGDDYLIALAASARAVLVSGDAHLLGLEGRIPVLSPARFVAEHLEH
jgi:predicted nucleic acid-binding protein